MEIAEAALRAPTSANVTVRSGRPREYLTEREIDKLIDAARDNRWGHRDATAILIAFRHGLRAGELVALRWDDIDWRAGKLHVRRSKGGLTGVHPLGGRELRALRRLQRETPDGARTVHIFVSERLAPLSVAGYQRMVARAGVAARFRFLISSRRRSHRAYFRLRAPSTAQRGRLSAHGRPRGGGSTLPVPDQQPSAAALLRSARRILFLKSHQKMRFYTARVRSG